MTSPSCLLWRESGRDGRLEQTFNQPCVVDGTLVSFCLISSDIYMVNDYLDMKADWALPQQAPSADPGGPRLDPPALVIFGLLERRLNDPKSYW